MKFLFIFLSLVLPAVKANAKTGDELKILAEILRSSRDLETVHSAALELAIDHDGKLILFNEMVTALDNVNQRTHRERLAEDLLIILTSDLGSMEKSMSVTIEQMINHADPRVRAAGALFLREHFTAKDPARGYFPAQPGARDRLGGYLVTWAEAQNQSLGPVLALLNYMSRFDVSVEVRAQAGASVAQIKEILGRAVSDKFPPKAKLSSQDERIIQAMKLREKIAHKYLAALSVAKKAGPCEIQVRGNGD